MPALLQRLQLWAEKRLPALTRHRIPEPVPISLHRRRIYIVPSRFGLGFAVLLMVMLVGSLNYANNAALLLTCLLGAASAINMLTAFRNLDGLTLRSIRAGNAFAGEPLELSLNFEASRLRQAIRIDLAGVEHHLDISKEASLNLPLPTEFRGWQELPRFRLWTTWSLGLFRAWSWLHPQQSVLVWPLPEAGGPEPPARADDNLRQRVQRGEDLASLRDYRAGDPIRHIAWKASARHDNLLVKDFEQPAAQPQWHLDWRSMSGLDNERRIARLARWVGEAHHQGRSWSLQLPGERIELDSGIGHYARCMNALALLP